MAWKNVQYENGKYRTSEGGGGGSSTFADLDDVNFSNLQNGQIPKYNSTTQKWENADESGGGGTVTDVQVDGVSVVNQQGVAEIEMPTPPSVPDKLSDLSDVQFSNLTDHQPLRYNATSQKWINGADNYPPLIYSDEEREVGVWRDGKPLYQRTFVKTLNSTSSPDGIGTAISSSEIPNCTIRHIEASWYTLPNGSEYVRYKDWEGYANFWGVGSDAVTYNARWGAYASAEAVITLKYTKTTDTPGSGTWTTQGALAHHYSTDEHIIGTWIDGKPLYEKTFQFLNYVSIPTKSWTTVMDVSSLSISKLVRCDFIDMEGVYWSGALNRISNGNLQSYVFEGWPVKELTLQYTKTTDV